MIDTIIYDYMKEAMDVPVYMEMPETLPKTFVLLDKTGSRRKNYIESATFAVQSYADSMYKAALLNDQVKEAMDSLIELGAIGSSKLQTDYRFTDLQRKLPRYQAVYEVTHY